MKGKWIVKRRINGIAYAIGPFGTVVKARTWIEEAEFMEDRRIEHELIVLYSPEDMRTKYQKYQKYHPKDC